MKYIINRSNSRQRIYLPPDVAELSGLGGAGKLEIHLFDGGAAVTKADLTAIDMINMIAALNGLVMDLSASVGKACGPCDGCGFCDSMQTGETVKLPQYILEEAGLPPYCKLEAFVEEGGVIVIEEADYKHDLSDVPPEILDAFRKSGICITELEERLMTESIIRFDNGGLEGDEND